MKSLSYSLISFAFLICSAVSGAVKKPSLEVKLSALDAKAGIIKINVKNTGTLSLNLFKWGTLLDAGPVRKVDVFAKDSKTPNPFIGIKTSVRTTNLTSSAFAKLDKNKSIQFTVNIAQTHDLSAGGSFTLHSTGLIPYAEFPSTDLSAGKSLVYKSNKLKVKIDAKAAAKAKPDYNKMLQKVKRDDCGGNRGIIETSLAMCSWIAANAAKAAFNGDAGKFAEYFKTADGGVRAAVGNRFNAIAAECGTINAGATQVGCTDWYNPPFCTSGILSYTVSPLNRVAFCPLFFSLPLLSQNCHSQDMASTTLHEMTHCPAVYGPETDDKTMGYDNDMRLSAGDAFSNADSYAMYANAVWITAPAVGMKSLDLISAFCSSVKGNV
ncbi:hypothetical protein EJ08DRAFT_705093 [Tothia fuscella]|uniref:Neutral protease 2 n=1 Tax=Tothia fuscella TaxID=1048955 RepID=A0A9P4NX92_9PEZI|nr:hypothetical protein EJ08DRAFT_705093 [Tothia fuscella]